MRTRRPGENFVVGGKTVRQCATNSHFCTNACYFVSRIFHCAESSQLTGEGFFGKGKTGIVPKSIRLCTRPLGPTVSFNTSISYGRRILRSRLWWSARIVWTTLRTGSCSRSRHATELCDSVPKIGVLYHGDGQDHEKHWR